MHEPLRSELTDDQRARIAGGLLLLVFVLGIAVYQVLRGPYVFADDFLVAIAAHRASIVASVLVASLGATLSVIVSAVLLGVFRRSSPILAHSYIAFCVITFGAIGFENYSALGLMETSLAYVADGSTDATLERIGALRYQSHRWAHLSYLLVSCLPVGVLYLALYRLRLVPRALALFGIGAVLIMGVEVTLTLFGAGLSDYALVPIALVQMSLPIWLLVKGFGSRS